MELQDHMTSKCAICKKSVVPEFRPFCSKRCKDVDLHRWLSGVYVIPGESVPTDEPEETEEPQ